MHWSCKSMSDGQRYVIIILVVSLVLRGEAVAHVRISTHLPVPRLWTCGSSYALIVHLGATPIYVPFKPQCNFMVSIIKRLPVLELFLGAPILEIIRYLPATQYDDNMTREIQGSPFIHTLSTSLDAIPGLLLKAQF